MSRKNPVNSFRLETFVNNELVFFLYKKFSRTKHVTDLISRCLPPYPFNLFFKKNYSLINYWFGPSEASPPREQT